MPKETIYQRDNNGPVDGTDSGRAVQVMWFRNQGHVTIGLVWNEKMQSTSGTDLDYSIHVELLNRDQVNDMIRFLRKARDQAFGEDA